MQRRGGTRPGSVPAWVGRIGLGLALTIAAQLCAGAERALVLAVHPYLPAPEIHARFGPLAAYLTRRVGLPFEVRVGRDYAEHIEAAGTGAVDVAFMGPASYVALTRRFGARPLLGKLEVGGEPWLHGAIVVRKDSPLRSLPDLRGKRFAFGDPNSTMSHLVPRAVLGRAGVGVASLSGHEFVRSHDNVALGVLAGHFDAGAVKDETARRYESRGLRRLADLPPIAEHVFVARPDLPPQVVDGLRAALLELRATRAGLAILQRIRPEATGVIAADDRDYAQLRTLLSTLRDVPIR